ncbi:MAG TPA: hypothetical protein DHU96_05205 [Actinobacteria bacterium]|nr:hypothetical protein [Actinomycetota bacterium]
MTYGAHLTELDRHHDALTADREAVARFRWLHAAHPDAFREDLVNALHNLEIDLHNLNLNDEAQQVAQELATLTDDPQ